MTEILQAKQSTIELLKPTNTPEAAFQSYEQLTNDSTAKKASFIAGEVRNPHFEYPYFYNLSEMDKGIITLEQAIDTIRQNEKDETVLNACETSLRFRQAEMEYVKILGRLQYLVDNNRPEDEVKELTEMARTLNKELYGEPDPRIADAARNELWEIIGTKRLHPSAQRLKQDLEEGFSFQSIPIAPLKKAHDIELRLPRFESDALEWAGEYILEKNADIMAAVDVFWENKVAEHGSEYTCAPDDIVEAFQMILDLREPNHESGVSIKKIDNKTALSWETPELAIHVGSKRAPITTSRDLFNKIMHEFGNHAQKCINGLNHAIPVMALGVYTNTARPDYLTFEEGLATTVEEMSGDIIPSWDAVKLGHYINIDEIANGADFRSVFEKAWRYRLLTKLNDNQEVTDVMIEKEKTAAYTACIRIFRGQPNDLSDLYPGIAPLSFNKDLAYLGGRVLAMNHIETIYETRDTNEIDFMFSGKFDPTIPTQRAIAEYTLVA